MDNYQKYVLKLVLASYFCSITFSPVFAQSSAIQLRSSVDKAVPAIDLKGGVSIDKHNRFINLSLRDSDLRQVLRMLADKADQNVILDDSVEGFVTFDLFGTTVNKAFEYIMTLKQLTYWQDGNTIIIASNKKAAELGINKQKIKPIKVKYVDANVVAKFLNKNIFSLNKPGSSSGPNTIVNPKTNEVLVFGNESDIALAQKVVDYIDVKPQISTFNVNYFDVRELAGLICTTVFKTQSGTTVAPAGAVGSSEVICSQGVLENAGIMGSLESTSYRLIADSNANQITIYNGTPEQIIQAQDIIKRFDKKSPQVYIEVSIIELTDSGSKQLNNAWSYTANKISYSFDSTGKSILNSAGAGGHTLTDAINAIISQNKGRILANPHLIATNNKKATVNITSEYIKSRTQTVQQTPVVGSASSGAVNVASNVVTTNFSTGDYGIQLALTPKISPNGYVTLDITPSYSSLGDKYYTPSLDGVQGDVDLAGTLVNKRDLSLNGVRIQDGQTLVVGGLIQENNTNTQSKIPLLSDIPFLGALFKNTDNEKTKTELILMITPKILKDNDNKTDNAL